MTEVYKGRRADLAARKKQQEEAARRKADERRALIRLLVFCILAAFCMTRVMISAANYAQVRNDRAAEASLAVSLNNRIGAVEFEIARETRYENISYKAALTLGMIDPDNPSSQTTRTK